MKKEKQYNVMKMQLKHSMLALWLGLFCMVAFVSCKPNDTGSQPTVERITERGTLLVGTTGDYRPLSYKETMLMSDGYLANGKTILCRSTDADTYQSLADIDKPEVRVMVNPGGVLMRKGQDDLLDIVNAVIAQMKADGTLRELHGKYGLVYGY